MAGEAKFLPAPCLPASPHVSPQTEPSNLSVQKNTVLGKVGPAKGTFCNYSQFEFDNWVIPCEKVSQNIDPSKNQFFVTNYQYWTGTSALQPFLTPPDPWGGLGGPRGVWGGLPTPKMSLSLGDQFQPWNAKFWVKTTYNTMFLRFWVKRDPSGTKKGPFGPK